MNCTSESTQAKIVETILVSYGSGADMPSARITFQGNEQRLAVG